VVVSRGGAFVDRISMRPSERERQRDEPLVEVTRIDEDGRVPSVTRLPAPHGRVGPAA
jgi:hypothetical protein